MHEDELDFWAFELSWVHSNYGFYSSGGQFNWHKLWPENGPKNGPENGLENGPEKSNGKLADWQAGAGISSLAQFR